MDQLIITANSFLSNMQLRWAVCGGYALDLFLNRTIRAHSDIDICAFESDRDAILHYMLQNNWRVYEFRGHGLVRPLDGESVSDTGRNFMCINGKCDFVKFYPCENSDLLYHEFEHTGIRNFNYIEFLFNQASGSDFIFNRDQNIRRSLSKSILFNGSIPYLAPEIVLLYKSMRADNSDYQLDFEQTFSYMNSEQKEWFAKNLDRIFPNGHRWKIFV